MLETAVLFIPFSRPEYARKTFDAIKIAKPKKLYFYSDKAREDYPNDVKGNLQTRALIDEVDWDCDLKTFFREKNHGAYSSVFDAIDWVFQNEDQAIILEEDCVPSQCFFDFCEQLLLKYKDDQRVWVISGNNFIEGFNPGGYDYTFSNFPYLWGWASWKTRWNKVYRSGLPIEQIKNTGLIKRLYGHNKLGLKVENSIQNVSERSTYLWDYALTWSLRINNGVGIIPNYNLSSNIGSIGTHNVKEDRRFHNKKLPANPKYNINRHPTLIIADYDYDKKLLRFRFRKPLLKSILSSLIRKFLR